MAFRIQDSPLGSIMWLGFKIADSNLFLNRKGVSLAETPSGKILLQ